MGNVCPSWEGGMGEKRQRNSAREGTEPPLLKVRTSSRLCWRIAVRYFLSKFCHLKLQKVHRLSSNKQNSPVQTSYSSPLQESMFVLGHFHHNTNKPRVSSLHRVCRTGRVGKSVHLSQDGRGAKEYNHALEKSLMDEKVVSVFISMVAEQRGFFLDGDNKEMQVSTCSFFWREEREEKQSSVQCTVCAVLLLVKVHKSILWFPPIYSCF